MKRLIISEKFLAISIAVVASTFIAAGNVSGIYPEVKDYRWQKAIEPGKGCFEGNCLSGQYAMSIAPLVAFDEKLFIIGQKSVWTSADGIKWGAEPKTDWGERFGMAYIFFDNKIWMLGGMQTWDNFKNDVWYTQDGKNWQLVTNNAGWAPRSAHTVLIFDGKMWLFGGAESSGQANTLPSRFFNDVWSSSDGVNWTRVTAKANWAPRDGHTGLVFENRMWMIGGSKRRDVWSSANGREWKQINSKAGWSERQNNGGLVFDNKMWIFGGRGLNDVWFSSNGKQWQMAFAQAPWSTRTAVQSVVFDQKLWIFSGKTGREDSWAGDVWTMLAE